MTGQQPVAKFRAGQVSSALWENDIQVRGGTVKILKATVQRRYKDKDSGEWKSSMSFSRNEIPLAIYCLQKAFEKIIDAQSEGSGDSNNVVEEPILDGVI
ncbi:MAG: hypothetical protein GY845_19850 [Planctomycetes bacterium]|nr:hypothetical protein [Planctomycetota bacterium]